MTITLPTQQDSGTEAIEATAPVLSIRSGVIGEGEATFGVILTPAWNAAVAVDWATADDTATDGVDYTAGSGTLTFAPGETSKTIAVALLDDGAEEDRAFAVNLSSPIGATIAVGQGIATIPGTPVVVVPEISIDDVTVTEGDGSPVTAVFTVTLSETTTETVTVDWATADDTAVDGEDYTGASGTLTFDPGDTSKTISIDILGETDVESDETFFVNLSSPVNATILDSQGVATITNDDSSPPVIDPLLDTFTGAAGSLATHTSDSGHTWSELYGEAMTTYHLTGSGAVEYATEFPGTDNYIVTSWVPDDDFYVEVDFEFDSDAAGLPTITLFLVDDASYNGVEVSVAAALFGGSSDVLMKSWGSLFGYTDSAPSGVALATVGTLRVDVNGDDFTVSANGVPLLTHTFTGRPAIGAIGLHLVKGDDWDNFRVIEIRGAA